MKRYKKNILSMGVISSVVIPTALIATSVTASANNTSYKESSANLLSAKSSSTVKDIYTGTTIPNVNPKEVEVFPNTWANNGFIKKIGSTTYVGTTNEGLKKVIGNNLFPAAKDANGKPDPKMVASGFIKEINGVIYVGTTTSGLAILEKGVLKPIKPAASIKSSKINVEKGFIEEIDGTIYVGGPTGIMTLNTTTNELKPVNNQLLSLKPKTGDVGFVKAINNKIYIGTSDGLRIFDPQTKTYTTIDPKIDIEEGIIETINNKIYIGTENGLMELKNNKLNLIEKKDMSSGFIKKIGDTTFVGNFNGLWRWDSDGFKLINSTSSTFISQIGETIYLGTSVSIEKLEFSEVAKANEDYLKNLFNDSTLLHQDGKGAKYIAKKIKDLATLKKYTGIDIPRLNYSSIESISAHGDNSTGKISLEIKLNTAGIIHTAHATTSGEKGDDESRLNRKLLIIITSSIAGLILLIVISVASWRKFRKK